MSEPDKIYVLGKRVALYQPPDGFRTAIDSVLLAAACPAKDGDSVLELGCGVGGPSFCLAARIVDVRITGIDNHAEFIDLAQKNVDLNDGGGRFVFEVGDVRTYEAAARFDHVMMNPPYMEAGTFMPSPSDGKARARGHREATLKDWLDAGFRNVKAGGSLTIIHRADAVDAIIKGLGKRFGAVEIIPLWPKAGQAAKRVIIRARKDRKTPATLHAGLILHEGDGAYTEQAQAVLEGREALSVISK